MEERIYENRIIFANHLLDKFKNKITGAEEDRISKLDPEDAYLIGKLSPRGVDNSDLSSTTNINSIGVEFIIQKDAIKNAKIEVVPKGFYFYRVLPTLQEQLSYAIEDAQKKSHNHTINSINDLVDYVDDHNKNYYCDVVETYEKIDIEQIRTIKYEFVLSEFFKYERKFGYKKYTFDIRETPFFYDGELEKKCYKIIREKVKIEDLLNEKAWNTFLARSSNEAVKPNWSFCIECELRPYKDDCYKVSVYLLNEADKSNLRINSLFDSGLKIKLINATYQKIGLEYFEDDYKYDKTQIAMGNNCTVFQNGNSELETSHLPIYYQYRLKTKNTVSVTFDDLINNPIEKLNNLGEQMEIEYQKWVQYRSEKETELSEVGKHQLSCEIEDFRIEIDRYKNGVRLIENFRDIQNAFCLMNKAFKHSTKNYESWRLFQIVFIVSLLADIGASEYSIEEMGSLCQIDKVDLLYFPTGGGKTEAFLGLIIFTLFFDRLRGKKAGISAIIKYPLRLLSIQQTERVAEILASAEVIRKNTDGIKFTEIFSLGYFVGDSNTPNKLDEERISSIKRLNNSELREKYQILDKCPFCKKNNVRVELLEEELRLIHRCDTPGCSSGGIIPLYIVDREIYRYLPSVIISTIDKIASIGFQSNFRNLMGEVLYKCDKHGYTSKMNCTENEKGIACKIKLSERNRVTLYDPAPTLLIQDELHLVRESLGVYDSHYETLFLKFVELWSSSKKKVKVVGATATISSYQEQLYHLYMKEGIRFPCASPFLEENFYSKIDKKEIQRLILGFAPFGKAIINSVVYSIQYMREIVAEYQNNKSKMKGIPGIEIKDEQEAEDILKDYWYFLQYNNVKLDGNKVLQAIENPINVRLEAKGLKPFEMRKMTGDDTFQDVRRILAQVETTSNVFEGFDMIIATSMISHGVDADKFNLMFFFGMPNNTAEYIQAYSRVGRKYPGLVIMITRPTREKDQSYLKNFVKFHEYKDILVEPVPINRWASRAIERTFPGILSALILNYYDFHLQQRYGNIHMMNQLKKVIIDGLIEKKELCEKIKTAYCCLDTNLGKQYEELIEQLVDNFFEKIKFENFKDKNCFITEGLMRLGFLMPMQSLRDTDVPVKIELN